LTCDERRALPTKTKAWLNVTASAKPQRCVRGGVASTRPDRKKTNAAKGKAYTATKASAVARKGEREWLLALRHCSACDRANSPVINYGHVEVISANRRQVAAIGRWRECEK